MIKLIHPMERNIKPNYSKFIKSAIAFGVFLLVISYCILYNWPLSCTINTPIVIPKGSSLSKVISTLKETLHIRIFRRRS